MASSLARNECWLCPLSFSHELRMRGSTPYFYREEEEEESSSFSRVSIEGCCCILKKKIWEHLTECFKLLDPHNQENGEIYVAQNDHRILRLQNCEIFGRIVAACCTFSFVFPTLRDVVLFGNTHNFSWDLALNAIGSWQSLKNALTEVTWKGPIKPSLKDPDPELPRMMDKVEAWQIMGLPDIINAHSQHMTQQKTMSTQLFWKDTIAHVYEMPSVTWNRTYGIKECKSLSLQLFCVKIYIWGQTFASLEI